MIQVIFKDLDKSDLVEEAAVSRLQAVAERFPDLSAARMTVTLSMQNSPLKAGPDLFSVKVYCRGGRYRGLTLEKSAPNLYAALADVVDHMLERLNRFGDRARVKGRVRARKLSRAQETQADVYELQDEEVLYEKNG